MDDYEIFNNIPLIINNLKIPLGGFVLMKLYVMLFFCTLYFVILFKRVNKLRTCSVLREKYMYVCVIFNILYNVCEDEIVAMINVNILHFFLLCIWFSVCPLLLIWNVYVFLLIVCCVFFVAFNTDFYLIHDNFYSCYI